MHRFLPAALIVALLFVPNLSVAKADELSDSQAELDNKQTELNQLKEEIDQLKSGQQSAATEANLATQQISRVNTSLAVAELQLEQTLLNISQVNNNLEDTVQAIAQLDLDISDAKQSLRQIVRSLYQQEQTSMIDVFLSTNSLSTVINDQKAYLHLQAQAVQTIEALRTNQAALAAQQDVLNQRQTELVGLRAAQGYLQADLTNQRLDQQNILALKQAEQADFEDLIAEAKQARTEIEQQIYVLKGTGQELALDDAYSAARYATSLTGVPPSILLAILKIETNVGSNLGSGVFPDDMHPASREAFLRVTAELGLDPYNTPISRRPASYKGWGGAIGPAQLLPDTYERLQARISDLMGKPLPDPFALPDALVAVGIMLADRGAADPAKQVEAIGRYLAGPNWMYHSWYSDRVLAVAQEYANQGL